MAVWHAEVTEPCLRVWTEYVYKYEENSKEVNSGLSGAK